MIPFPPLRRLFITLMATLAIAPASAAPINASKYFAYIAAPRPSYRHVQEYVFLSRERCPSKGAPSDAKAAMYFANTEQSGCWAERHGEILTCRANAEGVGNDCYSTPKAQILDIRSLPRAAQF